MPSREFSGDLERARTAGMCQCTFADRFYRYRADPEWWRCRDCDGRVRPIADGDAPILDALARQKETP